jgi:hypothetical protein
VAPGHLCCHGETSRRLEQVRCVDWQAWVCTAHPFNCTAHPSNCTLVQFLWQDDLVSSARFFSECCDQSKAAVIHLNQPYAADTFVNCSLSLSLSLSLNQDLHIRILLEGDKCHATPGYPCCEEHFSIRGDTSGGITDRTMRLQYIRIPEP